MCWGCGKAGFFGWWWWQSCEIFVKTIVYIFFFGGATKSVYGGGFLFVCWKDSLTRPTHIRYMFVFINGLKFGALCIE